MLGNIFNILRGIWETAKGIAYVLSTNMRQVWAILTTLFPLILVICSFFIGLYPWFKDMVEGLAPNIQVAINLLTESIDTVNSAIAAGWPPQVANAMALLNAYIPLVEASAAFFGLFALYMAMTLIRVIKALIPGVS